MAIDPLLATLGFDDVLALLGEEGTELKYRSVYFTHPVVTLAISYQAKTCYLIMMVKV